MGWKAVISIRPKPWYRLVMTGGAGVGGRRGDCGLAGLLGHYQCGEQH